METTVNIIPGRGYIIIEAWNDHCFVRVAERNNHFIYRLIKTSVILWFKTAVVRFRKVLK